MCLGLLLAHLALAAGLPQVSALPAPEALKQGLQHYREADFEGAIPYFQRAATATPDADAHDKAQAEVWLGLAFLNIGNPELAKESFRAALLADPGARLPDEAPPAAIPMYANIQGDLARSAPKPPPQKVAHADVPRAGANPAQASSRPRDDGSLAPDLTAPSEDAEVSSEGPSFRLPRWVPQAVCGVGAGLLVGGGYFKLASSSGFDDAAAEPNAARAAELSRRADSQQHLARGLALGGLGALVTGTVLYLLNE